VVSARRSTTESTFWGCFSGAEPRQIPIDSNGNLTQKTEGSDVWAYTWNALNQLTKVEKNSVAQARFSYDPLGRRVEKVAGGVTTSYTYESEDVIKEIRGASTLKYVHGIGIDEPLAVDDGTTLTYLHADGLGSINKSTSATGTVTMTRQYDAWGNLEVGVSEPGYAFTGREWDPEARLYHYRARYYDPTIGRFISEDPLGLAAGPNSYGYVNGSPAVLTDPMGLEGQKAEVDCSAVCAAAYTNPAQNSGGGGVMCFKGKACPCVFDTLIKDGSGQTILSIKKGECPEYDEIVMEHERKHCNEADCSNSDKPRRGGPAGAGPRSTAPEECQHRRDDVVNLARAAMAPGTSPNCAKKIFTMSQIQNIWVGANCNRRGLGR